MIVPLTPGQEAEAPGHNEGVAEGDTVAEKEVVKGAEPEVEA